MIRAWHTAVALALVCCVGGCCDGSKLVNTTTLDGGATAGRAAGSTSSGAQGSSSSGSASAGTATGGGSTGRSSVGSSSSGSSSSGTSASGSSSSGGSVCRGTPTFGSQAGYPVGNQPTWIAVGDLNSDGWPDLVVGNDLDSTVGVLLNEGPGGAGTFAAQVTYPVGTNPNAGVVIDVNGDGLPDIVVANQNQDLVGSVSVLLNLGGGQFATAVDTTACSAPVGLAAGDLNGDGQPDLVVGCSGYQPVAGDAVDAGVLVLLNQGAGTFGPGVVYPSAPDPYLPALGDLTGDGRLDVVISHEDDAFPDGGGAAGILLNQGDGTLAAEVLYPAGIWPSAAAVADLNGDGLPDLAVGSNWGLAGPAVSVLLNLGGGTFGAAAAYPAGSEPISPGAVALSGSGPLDLIVANANDGTIGVLVNAGNGTFGPQIAYSVGSAAAVPVSVVAADFNRDGVPDLAVAVNQYNEVNVLLGQCP